LKKHKLEHLKGASISPLLANVALHGLENMLKEYVETISMKRPNGTQLGKRDKRKSLTIIRYADDFIVMHESLSVVLKCKEILTTWLKPMGLELKDTKTCIRQTLYANLSQDGVAGFEFLGFHVTQRPTKYHSGHSSHGKNLGFQTIVLPSRKSCQKHQNRWKTIILKNKKQDNLIVQLNQAIIGWTYYFAVSNA
jgi:RNA-directed DNA polymerase